MYNLIDFVCICCGAYLAHCAVSMKKKGIIIENVILNKSVQPSAIKDKDGFIDYVYKRLLIIGIVIMLAGLADIINFCTISSNVIAVVSLLVFAAALVAYAMIAKAALKKFTDVLN